MRSLKGAVVINFNYHCEKPKDAFIIYGGLQIMVQYCSNGFLAHEKLLISMSG